MRYTVVCFLCLIAAACGQQASQSQPKGLTAADAAFQKQLQEQFLDAKPGTVIEIPAGKHALDRVLTLRANGVTIRGKGSDSSILSFKNEISGPEGMLVYGNDFTIENLSIEDTKGDGLKINDGENITIRGVRVAWTGGPKTTNGAYGIYPVKISQRADRGLLLLGRLGRRYLRGPVAPTSSCGAATRSRTSPGSRSRTRSAPMSTRTSPPATPAVSWCSTCRICAQRGHSTRVFKNKVVKNNLANFAAKGAAVASVPAGSGVVVNSNSQVEIFDNDIADNQTANLIISAYFSTNYYNKPGVDPNYDPYPRAIFVYDNRFAGGGDSPDGLDLKTLKVAMFGFNGRFPDILWDGYRDEKNLVNGTAARSGAHLRPKRRVLSC